MRVTTRDVAGAYQRMCENFRRLGVSTDRWELNEWRIGDGVCRYRVESHGGAREPLGGLQWMGRTEAALGLWKINAALELVIEARRVAADPRGPMPLEMRE